MLHATTTTFTDPAATFRRTDGHLVTKAHNVAVSAAETLLPRPTVAPLSEARSRA